MILMIEYVIIMRTTFLKINTVGHTGIYACGDHIKLSSCSNVVVVEARISIFGSVKKADCNQMALARGPILVLRHFRRQVFLSLVFADEYFGV